MSNIEPVVRNAPSARSAASKRLDELSPTLARIAPHVANSYTRITAERAERGQWPMTRTESELALRAAETGQAQVNAPKRGTGLLDIPGNALSDLRDLTTAAPRLFIPNRGNPLWKEVEGLASIGDRTSEALSSASNPIEAVGNLAMTPGIRMIPGSYVVGGLAGGTDPTTGESMSPGDLLRHPLFTGLDVLPYAQAAAKGSRVARAASAERTAATAARRTAPDFIANRADGFRNFTTRAPGGTDVTPTSIRPPRERPLRDVLTRRATSETTTELNVLGRMADRLARQAKIGGMSGRIGTKLGEMGYGGLRGRDVRGMTRTRHGLEGTIHLSMAVDDPTMLRELIGEKATLDLVEKSHAFHAKYATELADDGLKAAFEHGNWSHLPREFVDDYRALMDDTARYLEDTTGRVVTDAGSTFMSDVLRDRFRGEVLDAADARRLGRIDRRWTKAKSKVDALESEFDNAVRVVQDPALVQLKQLLDDADAAGDLDPTLLTPKAIAAAQDFRSAFTKLESAIAKGQSVPVKTRHLEALSRARAGLGQTPYRQQAAFASKPLSQAQRAVGKVNRNLSAARKELNRTTKGVMRAADTAVPARFVPLVRDDFLKRVEGHLNQQRAAGMASDLIDETRAKLDQGIYADLPALDRTTLMRFMREANAEWYRMRSDGLDPVFVHHAPPMTHANALRPQVGARLTTASQAKKRTWDISPSENSVHLALKHQEMEWLTDAANREFVDVIDSSFARPEQELIREWADVYAKAGVKDNWAAATEAVERTTTIFEPSAYVSKRRASNMPSGPGGPASEAGRPVMRIDKSLANAIDQMHQPAGYTAIFDPVMNVFRTAILPLSPRWHCVPEHAEILTRRGWLTHEQVTTDDIALTFDMERQLCEWQQIEDVSRFDHHGNLHVVDGFEATHDHRWPVVTQWDRPRSNVPKIKRGYELSKSDYLYRAAPKMDWPTSDLTPREAAIVGWLWTDGTFTFEPYAQGRIYQSPRKHLDEIIDLLGADGGAVAFDYRTYDNTGLRDEPACGNIVVRAKLLHRLRPYLVDPLMTVTRLGEDAATAMWDAMLKAEGSLHPSGLMWTQNPGPVSDAFQVLSFLLGHKMDTTGRQGQPTTGHILAGTGNGTKSGVQFQVKRHGDTPDIHRGIVWCPKTPNGTWVMRQGGRMVITGNTYNILGGAAMVTAENPRIWRSIAEAYKQSGSPVDAMRAAWKEQEVVRPASSSRRSAPRSAPPLGVSTTTIPDEAFRTPKGSPTATGVLGLRNHATGAKMGQLWDQVQQSPAGSMSKKFGRFVSASHALNQWWDDLYRTATAIDTYDTAIKKGKSAVAAEEAAGEAVRTIMQSWDELTPAERTIMRSVFPFYSFARFAVGFVMRYPFDHSLRSAVIAQFARNELEDQGSAFGRDMMALFPLSGPDANGDSLMLRTSGVNPFRDVADWFTLSGFVGQTNPLISATLQSLGVEPRTGGPMLYPDLRYDPETGGMVADTPSWLPGVITGTIPQLRFVENALGLNKEFAAIAERNPDAAGRMLIGQIGLPAMVEQVNLPGEAFKAERNRYQALKDAADEALRTGDLSKLDPWDSIPGVRAYREELERLDAAGELDQYRSQAEAPGVLEAGLRGIVPQGSA